MASLVHVLRGRPISDRSPPSSGRTLAFGAMISTLGEDLYCIRARLVNQHGAIVQHGHLRGGAVAAERPTAGRLLYRVRWATSLGQHTWANARENWVCYPCHNAGRASENAANMGQDSKAALSFMKANDPEPWCAQIRAVRTRASPEEPGTTA